MNQNLPPPDIQEVSIVLLGSFNPAILHPLWFSRHGLISEQEAENADIQIVHPDATIFQTDWFLLQVVNVRFMLATVDPARTLPLKDLALGTFKILEHVPIKAFGMNRRMHFSVLSREELSALGDHYAPKTSWNEILTSPELRSLRIAGKRDQCEADQIEARIEVASGEQPSVAVHINQHYQLDENKDLGLQPEVPRFLEILNRSWDDFLAYSEQAAFHLLADYSKAKEG